MIVHDMTCIERDPLNQGQGAIYQDIVTVLNGLTSEVYFLPVRDILGIAASISGTGVISFTTDSRAKCVDESAEWFDWDAESTINPAVTAFRVTSTSGTVVGKVTIRTNSY